MRDAAGWLAERYGGVVFALLLTGVFQRAEDEAMWIRVLYPRWREMIKCRTVFGEGLLTTVRMPADGGFRAGPTWLGKLWNGRGLACEVGGLALFLMMLGNGAYSTLLGGVAYDWDNGDGTNVWGDGNNWSPNAPAGGPTAGDSATFNGTSNTACAIDLAVTVDSITMATGYGSTLSMNASTGLTVSGALSMTSATATCTFATNGETVSVGSWSQSGISTVATPGSSTVTVNGNFSHTNGTHNTGTGEFILAATANLTMNSALNGVATNKFYRLTINVGVVTTLTNGDTCYTQNTITVNGTIQTTGPAQHLLFGCLPVVDGVTVLAGSGSVGDKIALTLVEFKANGNLTATVNFTGDMTGTGDLYVSNGPGNTGDKTLQLLSNFTRTGSAASLGCRVIGTAGAGTSLNLDLNGFNLTLTADAGQDALQLRRITGNVWIDASTGSSIVTLNTGRFNVFDAVSYVIFGASSWNVSGNWRDISTSASWNAGTATLTFTGGSPTWEQTAAADHIYNLRINISGTMSTTTTNFRCSNQLRVSGGILTPSVAIGNVGSYLVDGGTFNWNNAAHAQADLTTSSGNLNFSVSDTMTGKLTFNGGTIAVVANVITQNVSETTIAGGSVTFTTGSWISNAAFTMTSGTFGSNTAYTLDWNATVDVSGGTFEAPSGNNWTCDQASIMFRPLNFNNNGGRFVCDRAGAQRINVRSTFVFDEVEALGGGDKLFVCSCTINTEIETAGTVTIQVCRNPGGGGIVALEEAKLLEV